MEQEMMSNPMMPPEGGMAPQQMSVGKSFVNKVMPQIEQMTAQVAQQAEQEGEQIGMQKAQTSSSRARAQHKQGVLASISAGPQGQM